MRRDVMPLTEAAATATTGGMLRDENRVPSPRGLLPIVSRFCRCQTLPDEIPRMLFDLRTPLLLEVGALLLPQMKSRTKLTLTETLEQPCHRRHIDAILRCPRSDFL